MAIEQRNTIVLKVAYEGDHGEDASAAALALGQDLLDQDGVAEVMVLPVVKMDWDRGRRLEPMVTQSIEADDGSHVWASVKPVVDSVHNHWVWEIIKQGTAEGKLKVCRIGMEPSEEMAIHKAELALVALLATMDNTAVLNKVVPTEDDEDDDKSIPIQDFGMFSPSGNLLVSAYVANIILRMRDGQIERKDEVERAVRDAQDAISPFHGEVHDTAVREAIWAAVEGSQNFARMK